MTEQKNFSKIQLSAIKSLSKYLHNCYKMGIVFEGKNREIIAYRKDNYDQADINFDIHKQADCIGTEHLKYEIVDTGGAYLDSGSDDMKYFK